MKLTPAILVLAAASLGIAQGQTSYTSTTATTAWNAARWNNTADAAPYTSTFTANNAVSFTSGTYTFAGMGAATNVGDVTVAPGVRVSFASNNSTYATGGAVRTINVGAGGLFDLNGNAFSTAVGTGLIKSGDGVFGTGGGDFTGGFTLSAGTVIARGTTGLGSGATNTLVLNGGTLASNATRSFANTRFGGGIMIGGDVQFGELATVVSLASSSANLSFANNVGLGSATRTLTQGNNGTHTFSGIVSNTSDGLTFAANANTDGRFELTNPANTFTGNINVNGGEVRFTADGSLGIAANDIIIDGGRFAKASDALTVNLGAGRDISVGDAAGTSISSPGTGTLVYNNAIANKSGETGSWAKQGGGTLELGGVSTYTGSTSINNGTVKLTTSNNRLPTGTVVSVGQAASANLGTLDLNGLNQQITGLNSTAGTNATASNNTVTSATAATLTLGGSGAYSYGDGTDANSGVITGAISLVKQGNGSQTLGDTNTYTGPTTVTAGKLVVNGSITSATTVSNAGSTLGGSGTITGNVGIGSGAILAAGNSVGKLTTVGTTTLSSGSIFEWELGSTPATTGRGTAYDAINTTTLDGSGAIFRVVLASTQDFSESFWDTNQTWADIFTNVAGDSNLSIASVFSSVQYYNAVSGALGSPAATQGSFTFDDNNLNWTAVPEPSSALAGLLLGAALLRRRRVG